jgi:hypothetical protein
MRKTVTGFSVVVLCLFAGAAWATTPAEEAAGLEPAALDGVQSISEPQAVATRDEAVALVSTTGLLLIPESTNDRVMAFDPMTGDLVFADFIPSDFTNLSTPIHALLSADGASILVSDQIVDVVQSYDLATGAFNGTFAPAGGVDTSILDNIRGMTLKPDGNLLVTVGGGLNADSVAEFDTGGNFLGNFIANGAGGLASPFDVLYTGTEYLVGGNNSDLIHRYDTNGTSAGSFAGIDTFPEQLALADNGNLLVGNFSGAQEGVVEFNTVGGVVGVYDPASLGGYRGSYELANGNILTTNGSGVHEIDRSGNLVETKIAGVSARFIELVSTASAAVASEPTPVPAFSPLALVLLILALTLVAVYGVQSRAGY